MRANGSGFRYTKENTFASRDFSTLQIPVDRNEMVLDNIEEEKKKEEYMDFVTHIAHHKQHASFPHYTGNEHQLDKPNERGLTSLSLSVYLNIVTAISTQRSYYEIQTSR